MNRRTAQRKTITTPVREEREWTLPAPPQAVNDVLLNVHAVRLSHGWVSGPAGRSAMEPPLGHNFTGLRVQPDVGAADAGREEAPVEQPTAPVYAPIAPVAGLELAGGMEQRLSTTSTDATLAQRLAAGAPLAQRKEVQPVGAATVPIQRQVTEGETQAKDTGEGAAAPAVAVDYNAMITTKLEDFVKNFSNIPVVVSWQENNEKRTATVFVRPPYFINTDRYKTSAERLHRVTQNRADATEVVKKVLKASSSQALVGKSTPDDIKAILQKAVDGGDITPGAGKKHLDPDDLHDWLDNYGIGIDCSGYVAQALNEVIEEVQKQCVAPFALEKTWTASLRSDTSAGADKFDPVTRPDELRPGDTMSIKGHVRIVVSVTQTRDAVDFTTAESAGSKGGPATVSWRYPKGDEFKKLQKQSGAAYVKSSEKPVFSRYKALDKLEAEQAASGNQTPSAAAGVQRHGDSVSIARLMTQREGEELAEKQGTTEQVTAEVGLEGGPLSPELARRINARRGSGAPLDADTRTQMEGAFGTSFADVSVHADAESDALNRGVSAVAFTTGRDIFFRQGAYQPGSNAGRQLLAHELTHVVQQRSISSSGPMTVGAADDSHEQEADAVSAAVARMPDAAATEPPAPPAAAGAAPVARAIQRQAVADAPPAYTPVAPMGNPDFAHVVGQVGHAAQTAKAHDATHGMVEAAQDAAPTPANDALSKGQARQAQTMTAAQPGKPDKTAFLALLRQKLDAIAPRSDSDLKNFKSSGRADQMQTELKQHVQGQKERAQAAIASATNAPPPPAEARMAGPAPSAPGAPALPQVQADKAVPPPAPDPGPAFAQQAQAIDQKMADARMTAEQLQKANDPRFSAVVDARDQVHANAATAPAQFQAQQQEILARTRGEAQGAITSAHGRMEQAHAHAHAGAHAEQQAVMDREAQKRKEVADHIEKMFEDTKDKVEARLKALDGTVDQMFTAGEKPSRDIFEAEIDRRTTAYWLDHPFSAFAGWLTESDPTKENIWHEERDNYMKRLDGTLERIAAHVEGELQAAKDIIAQGHAEIDKYVAGLEPALRQSGQQAEHALDSGFGELQHSVDTAGEELANHLVQKYQVAQKAIDDRLKELKESEKGLLSSFEEKLAAVEKAIDEFKKRLQGVVTDAEETLELIIHDPVAFLGHLLDALKQGFMGFVGNIAMHLEQGFVAWLTGSLGALGIELPEEWDLKGVISLVLQVLGVTWDKITSKIRAKVAQLLGPRAMQVIDKIVEYAEAAWNGGIAGLIEKAKEDLGNLKDMVFGAIKSYLIETIVKQAIAKLVALSNPVGEIVEAVMDIYKVVMFFVEKAGQIMHVVETIVKSVSRIAHGDIGGAAQWIENAMAATIPDVIGFLAYLLNLGDLPNKVKEFITNVQEMVDHAIDTALEWLVEQGTALFASLFGKDEQDEHGLDERTLEQKQADLDKALAEADELLKDDKISVEKVKKRLPAIRSQYRLTSLELFIDSETVDNDSVHVEGKINPNGSTPEEQKPKKAPTGSSRDDPIPFTWFKPPEIYPTTITLPGLGNQEYRRGDSTTIPIGPGEDQRMPLGVVSDYWPTIGKLLQLVPESRGGAVAQFRAVLEYYGFNWSGLQADHVLDLNYGGPDVPENIWPADQAANNSAGARQNSQDVTYADESGEQKTAKNGTLIGRWFKITKVEI